MMIFFLIKKEIAISVDTYNEGTHFPKSPELGLLIKKIIRSSISDLICKGVNLNIILYLLHVLKNIEQE